MITLKEIARLAGVSRGTVDRALHDRPGVNQEVAERIRCLAKEAGYVPDRAGKALSCRRNPIKLGVILNSRENPFFTPLIAGLRQAERDYADYSLQILLCECKGFDAGRQAAYMASLAGEAISGLILTPVNDEQVKTAIRQISEKFPVVTVNTDIEDSLRTAYVGCDYIASGKTAAQLAGLFTAPLISPVALSHATDLQSVDAAIIIGSIQILGHTQRVSGFSTVCKEEYPHMKVVDVLENNDDDTLSYEAVSSLLQNAPPRLLYFAAGGVEGGLKAVDAYCPPEKRPIIIACDETPVTKQALLDGRIQAVISQQPFEQGYEAVRIAMDAAVNHRLPESDRLYMQNEIKIRHNL